jgi:SAM-dependent methyltransferase
MAAKLRLDDLSETGTVVGGLSAAGTAGALAGTFVTGFVLVAALPSRPIVIGVGALLVLGGLVLWVRLTRSRPSPPAVVGVLVAALLAPAVSGPCQYETAYFCARVEADPARPSGRILWLDRLRHSYVDLADPTHLEFRYVRLFADVVDALPPGRLDALHVGGGGFTFPRYLSAHRPGTGNLVLEIDPDLVRIAEKRLGLRRGPELRVDIGDARLALRDLPTDGFDVVVGDAFSGMSVPWHLTTAEVVAELDRALRPDGVYVANVIDGGASRFARAELATLQRSFDHVAVILPPERPGQVPIGNQVLVASDAPLPADLAVDPADGRLLGQLDEVAEFVDGAPALTDAYAPVDQIITRR